MILKTTLLLSFVITSITLNAQTFEWAKSIGAPSNDFGNSITTDAVGNVYTIGTFEGTVDFDPGAGVSNLTSAGAYDIVIQKMDASGNFIWAKSFGGSTYDYGYSITLDAVGNIYTTGSFQQTVDFDPNAGVANLTSTASNDIFVQKLDASGNFVWAKSFQGGSFDMGISLILDEDGDIYITGYFEGTVDFDPGAGISNLTSAGTYDIFVEKLTTSGDFIWAAGFGGPGNEIGYSVTVDTDGNVYTTGFFSETVDFDPGVGTTNLTSAGAYDGFVQKMNASGDFIWAKQFGDASTDAGHSVAIDPDGNIYTTGYFNGTVDFDPGVGITNLTSAGSSEVFVQKLDPSGDFVWAQSFGGTASDFSYSVTVDAAGNVYTTGSFEGTADLDPGSGTLNVNASGGSDIFVQKLDPSGNFIWAHSFGGAGFDVAKTVRVDASGNVFTSGFFEGTVDFEPGAGITNLTSAGYSDIFVHKISQCVYTSGTDVVTACDSYSWIDGNTYVNSNNTAMHTLITAAGCDSIVTLNLTINHATSGTDVQTACDSYTWIDGNTYTTSNNTATFTLTGATGCDSVVTLNLTINSVSDVSTTVSGLTITANNANAGYRWLDCDNNYVEISGETNQSFIPSFNGNYAVELSENGCVDTSSCVTIATVGMNELVNQIEVLVSPNPTSGAVLVSFQKEMHNVLIVVTTLEGKVISQKHYDSLSGTNFTLDEANGIYFMTIKNSEGQRVIKILKE